MARPRQEVVAPIEQAEPEAPRFILKKNAGLTVLGKPHQFFPAGTEFDPDKDGELITKLVQSGAIFE